MCEELQATVAELSEARELSKQLALQRDQGEGRLQSILRCIYEQNTVLGSLKFKNITLLFALMTSLDVIKLGE